MWCLNKIINPKDIKSCYHKDCELHRLCEKCLILHKETHLAKDYPVSQLINNMINLP